MGPLNPSRCCIQRSRLNLPSWNSLGGNRSILGAYGYKVNMRDLPAFPASRIINDYTALGKKDLNNESKSDGYTIESPRLENLMKWHYKKSVIMCQGSLVKGALHAAGFDSFVLCLSGCRLCSMIDLRVYVDLQIRFRGTIKNLRIPTRCPL
jgi:hypothetical protein